MIPKIIHLTWATDDILDIESPMIKHGIANYKLLSPAWDVQVSSNEDIDFYLLNSMSKSDYDLIRDKHPVVKSDVWRLYKMYNEGGMYVDVDRLCNKSLDDIIRPTAVWVLPACKKYDFSQDLMISAPGNPVYLKAIELVLERRRKGVDNTYYLGPQTYMHAITQSLFGTEINTNPGEDIFDQMLEQIKSIPFIDVIVEEPPCNTLLYDGDITPEEHEVMKRALYRDTGLKHWTGEW